MFDFGLRDAPLLRIFLIKLFHVLEQSPRPLWAHSSKDHFVSNETSAETTASLSAMKLPELKALAASRGLKGISQLRKSQLIELLSNGAGASTWATTAPTFGVGPHSLDCVPSRVRSRRRWPWPRAKRS